MAKIGEVGFCMKHNDTQHNESGSEDLLDREALSALMDNELSDFELRRLLKRIEQKPQLLAEWERFGLVRAAMQPDPLRSALSPDFSSRVMDGIEASLVQDGPLSSDYSQQASTPGSGLTGWARNATRFAVAASVTFAVFIGMQAVLQGPGAGDAMPTVASDSVSGNDNQQLAVDADAQQRLNDYIRSVTIPARIESQSVPYNVLLDSPQLRPVSDRELLQEVEREPQQR
jgi:negative regulator of sigma E activity